MNVFKLFFLLPLLALCSVALAQSNYDHHWLVQTWPNGYCSGNPCGLTVLPQRLVIHGLWPANSSGLTPTLCSNTVADPKPLFKSFPPQLQNDMSRLWPSIGKWADNEKFWVHEWQQHGSCQAKPPQPYYSTAIQLMKSTVDLDLAIKAAIPVGGFAPRGDIINAVRGKVGNVTPLLRCVRKPNGNYLLSEITVCVDKQGIKVISCNVGKENVRDNCGTTIKFPARVE